MRILRLCLWAGVLVGCAFDNWQYSMKMYSGDGLYQTEGPPTAVVGDTLQFIAAETQTDPNGVDVTFYSNIFPDQFTWSSSPMTVAEFVSPGRLALKSPGQVTIEVRTKHSMLQFKKTVIAKP